MKRTVPSKCSCFDRGWLEFPSAAMTLLYKCVSLCGLLVGNVPVCKLYEMLSPLYNLWGI